MESCKQSQKFSCSRWIDTGKETLDRLAKIAAEKARGTQVETKLLFTAFCIISTPFSFQFLSLCQRLREPDHMKSICQRYHLYLLYLYIICISFLHFCYSDFGLASVFAGSSCEGGCRSSW